MVWNTSKLMPIQPVPAGAVSAPRSVGQLPSQPAAPPSTQTGQVIPSYAPSVGANWSTMAGGVSLPTQAGFGSAQQTPNVFSGGVFPDYGSKVSKSSFSSAPNPTTLGPGQMSGQAPMTQTQRDAVNKSAGLDFMKPGAVEQFYADHGTDLFAPGAVQQWQADNQQRLSQPSMSSQFAAETIRNPMELPSANMDPYYDRAEQLTTRRMAAEQAARGGYGSSVGINATGEAVAGLRAQQAKDEADYGLSRAGLGLQRTSILGNLAQGADSAELARSNLGLNAATSASNEALSRWRTSQGAAGDAQAAQRTRGQDFFQNNMAIGQANSGVAGAAYEGAGSQDQAIMDAIIALGIGTSAESVAAAMSRANEDVDFRNSILQALALYKTSQGGEKK